MKQTYSLLFFLSFLLVFPANASEKKNELAETTPTVVINHASYGTEKIYFSGGNRIKTITAECNNLIGDVRCTIEGDDAVYFKGAKWRMGAFSRR
ncbi:MAG: hypothetical protein LIO93_11130 [Bacteroidales bacterium]|nr:hypothetical protein [Bacteroidales bacterium]